MTTEENLLRDIETLRESIRGADQNILAGENVTDVLEHGRWCLEELSDLLGKLEALKKGQTGDAH